MFQLAAAEVSRGTNSIVTPGGVIANFLDTDDSEQLIAIACGAVTPTTKPKLVFWCHCPCFFGRIPHVRARGLRLFSKLDKIM